MESRAGDLERRFFALRRLPNKAHSNQIERDHRNHDRLAHRRFGEILKKGIRPISNAQAWLQMLMALPAWLAFFGPVTVYLLTACSTVYNLDSAEFSAAAHVLGIVRATGYPLYLLLGKAFTLLMPMGDVAFRLNVMSALCAAGTIALIYRILWSLTRQRVAALSASFLFAFSYYFWTQAVVAEVYTLHTLLMASLLLLLLRWEATRSDGLLVAFGLLYGLSFGNHMSTILLAPGFALFLFAVDGRALLRPRHLLLLLLPFLAGLGVYLYLPVRYQAQPAFNYVGRYDAQGNFIALDLRQPANLWWLVSGKAFRGLMFDYTPAELVKEVGQAAYRLWGNYLGIGLVPGLMGGWVQMRKKPRHFALFGVLFAANLVFFINYRVVDKAVMFVPAYLVWAVWIGEGFNWLVRWVQGPHRTGSPPPVWAWGLLVMVIVPLVVNWPLVNVHDDTRARDLADAALMHASRDAIILGWWTSVPPIQYLQLVENRRPDLLVINRFLIGADEMYALIDHSLGNRPVYVMELDEGLAKAYQPVSLGPMYELAPRRLAEANP
jgi:4-amino-4-deoxy-L-arabinose transferase-like glycosyltransferase